MALAMHAICPFISMKCQRPVWTCRTGPYVLDAVKVLCWRPASWTRLDSVSENGKFGLDAARVWDEFAKVVPCPPPPELSFPIGLGENLQCWLSIWTSRKSTLNLSCPVHPIPGAGTYPDWSLSWALWRV